MKAPEIAALTKDLLREVEKPNANRDSLRRHLIEERGLPAEDAGALSAAICRKLLEERFPPVTEMELMLTEDCNQRCHYCFIEGKNKSNRMPTEVARQAVNFLFRHSRDKTEVKILLFGGEPMLEFELIERITFQAEEQAGITGKTVKFDMTTNGTLFNEEKTAFLAKHHVKFLLSLDGNQETHDRHRKSLDSQSSYEKIMKNLPVMKKYQPWLGTRMTVHPDTVHLLYGNVLYLAGLGINQFLIGPATGLDWTEAELDTYQEEMIRVSRWLKSQLDSGRQFRVNTLEEDSKSLGSKRGIWGCRAGRHSITVTARGEIFPCSKMLGVKGLKGICRLGTLDEGMTEIYHRLSLCGMIPIERTQCDQCPYRDSCTGGCYATNYQATGSIFRPDPFECRLKRRTVEVVRQAERILGPGFYQKLSNQ